MSAILGMSGCVRDVAFVVNFWAEVDCGGLEIREIGFGRGSEGTWLNRKVNVYLCIA